MRYTEKKRVSIPQAHVPWARTHGKERIFMRIGIGIDTGGTCTDAVLYDLDSRTVLGSNKALTTHGDLMQGILNALDGLDPALCRQAELAGLSTTLATNACVEGKFRRARLLLLGIDRTGIERNGAPYGLTDPDDIRYLPCRTTIQGKILEEPDWALLRRHAKAWFHDVEAAAVCEIYAIRNQGVLEQKAAEIIAEETGLPVMQSSALFGDLPSLERGASALLNAGLLPITREFLDAAEAAFRVRGIGAELLVVRSDSSLMSRNFAMEHAVETLLSGPAASALGGSAMTGRRQAVIVDMGGTTTDIALIDGGTPLLCADGIRVGQWKTLVKGLASTSFALGGDSVIRWRFTDMTIGPERVIPLCVLAARHPQIVDALRRQVRETPRHTLFLHEFLTLGRQDWACVPALTPEETRLCRMLEQGPLSLQDAAGLLHVDKYLLDTRRLEEAGVVLRAGLTPTDIMHVRGDYTAYSQEAAELAVRFVAASLDREPEALCQMVYTEIQRQVFFGVSQMLLEQALPQVQRSGLDDGLRALLAAQWAARDTGRAGLLDCLFHTPAVLIGIGGPVHLFLAEAARALRAEYTVPDYAATANAVGAVTGRICATVTAEVRMHALDSEHSNLAALVPGCEPRYFDEPADALAWCREQARIRAVQQVRAQGAVGAISVTEDETIHTVGLMTVDTQVRVTASTCADAAPRKETHA